jgi:hypothetical protein
LLFFFLDDLDGLGLGFSGAGYGFTVSTESFADYSSNSFSISSVESLASVPTIVASKMS